MELATILQLVTLAASAYAAVTGHKAARQTAKKPRKPKATA